MDADDLERLADLGETIGFDENGYLEYGPYTLKRADDGTVEVYRWSGNEPELLGTVTR